TRYCYVDSDGNEAPNLRLNPGDLLILRLKNAAVDAASMPGMGDRPHAHMDAGKSGTNCASDKMTPQSTNLHFHGIIVPPVCHQDDVLNTSIEPNDPPFEYRFRIPEDTPPGLYWYHPHIHGFTKAQVLGGASGAIIVEGIERAYKQLAGLPE